MIANVFSSFLTVTNFPPLQFLIFICSFCFVRKRRRHNYYNTSMNIEYQEGHMYHTLTHKRGNGERVELGDLYKRQKNIVNAIERKSLEWTDRVRRKQGALMKIIVQQENPKKRL